MKKKLIIEGIKLLISLYMVLAFILMINGNFEALHLNLIGFLMMAVPCYCQVRR